MTWEPPHRIWQNADTIQQQIAARDLFALGCYLIRNNQSSAGYKACWSALEGLNAPLEDCKLFIRELRTDTSWIRKNIGPHLELLLLFNSSEE